jgi:hypothetical protein
MTKVKIVFSLSGDTLDPKIVSNTLQLNATNSWKKGDQILGGENLFRKEGCWRFSTDYMDSLDIGDQFQIIQQMVNPRKDKLKSLIESNGLFVKFDIVVKVIDKAIPKMTLRRDVLKLANELGAIIDFDIRIE